VCAGVDEATLAAFIAKKSAPVGCDVSMCMENIRKTVDKLANRHCRALLQFANGWIKSPALQAAPGSDIQLAEAIAVQSMDIVCCLLYQYPRIIVINEDDTNMEESFRVVVVHMYRKLVVWVDSQATEERVRAFVSEKSGREATGRLNQVIMDCYRLSRKHLPVEVIFGGTEQAATFREMSRRFGDDIDGFIQQMVAMLEKWRLSETAQYHLTKLHQ
jgi:hypothetical protein